MSGTAHQPASTRGGREAEFTHSAIRPGEAALLPVNGLRGARRWFTHRRPDRQACGRPGHHAAGGESTTSSLTRSVRMKTLRSPHPRRPSSAPATARTRPPGSRPGSSGPASTAAAAWKRRRSRRPSARRDPCTGSTTSRWNLSVHPTSPCAGRLVSEPGPGPDAEVGRGR